MKKAVVSMVTLSWACHATPPAVDALEVDTPASAQVPWQRVESLERGIVLAAAAHVVTSATATADIMSTQAAVVRAISVTPGDRVEAGQDVGRLSSPAVAEAAAIVLAAAARLRVLGKRLGQLKSLKTAGLARRDAIFDVELAVATTRGDRRRALARLKGAMVPLGDIEALAADGAWSLTSPVAGVVTDVSGRPGHVVGPDDPPLVRVSGIAPARVEAQLTTPPPRARARFVAADGTIYPLRPHPRTVILEPTSGLWRLWVDFLEPRSLPPALQGTLQYFVDGPAASVPAGALMCAEGMCDVHRLRGGKTATVPVTKVWSDGAIAVVVGDLATTDHVSATRRRP